MRWTVDAGVRGDGGGAAVPGRCSRVRRRGVASLRRVAAIMVAHLVLAGSVRGQDLPVDPGDFVLAAGGDLSIGNATRVPGPVGANGTLLLDERVRAPLAIARKDVKLRLLATVTGNLTSVGGGVQLANQARVEGDLVAARNVVVGVSARVLGDVVSSDGGVRIVRLARVDGDVYSDREFKGDRDVVVGSPGSRVEVRGPALLRDRSEYFAAILHEGPLELLGRTAPLFHASVTAVSPGTLAAPSSPAWRLEAPALEGADPGAQDVVVSQDDGPVALAPGRYGALQLGRGARVLLGAGDYDFAEIVAQSDARLRIAIGPSESATIRVARDVRPGRRFVLDLATSDAAVRRDRAARLRTVVGGTFRGDQDVVWAGAILARKAVVLGKHTTLVGSAWSAGDVEVGRDSILDWVRADPGV